VLEVSWKQENGTFEMDVEIPVGSSATVVLPNGEEKKLASGIHRVSCKM
jgi:alpha-L-rhamnosidase